MVSDHLQSRPVLVFVHGFGTNSITWQFLDGSISNDYECCFIDLAGYGTIRPPLDFNYSVPEWAAQCADAVNRQLNGRAIVIVGHSLGCAVAIEAVLSGLIAPRALILTNPLIYPQAVPRYLGPLATPVVGGIISHLIPPQWQLESAFQQIFHHPERFGGPLRASYVSLFQLPHFRRTLRRTVRSLKANPRLFTDCELEKLTMPLYLILSDHDGVVAPERQRQFVDAVHSKKVIRLPDCGHAPQEECPKQWNGALRTVLEDIQNER
jgi:pimeloyl-ACP methyl ester carboxylesterase